MQDFLSVKNEWHSNSCACEQQIDWNIPLISGSNKANGFIVQSFQRVQIPSNCLGIPDYDDIHYFEAWCVENGSIIPQDKGEVCNDMFAIGNPLDSFSSFYQSLGTSGSFQFDGTIFWIPKNSPLYEIIDKWKRSDVKQTAGLKASYSFPEIENIECVFKRNPFIHSWDLTNEKRIYIEAKTMMFKYCPRNTEADKRLLVSTTYDLLGENYRHIAQRIIGEWEQQWQCPTSKLEQ